MALNSDAEGKKMIEYSPEDTFEALSSVFENNNRLFTIKEANKLAKTFSVKTGVSGKSWGENLQITINPTGNGMSELLIASKSKFGLIDWGRNQENINSIMNLLAAEFKQGQYQKSLSSIAQDIPNQIKELSELKDAGILTKEEFELKKTELLAKI